jgi:hypothetical protein
MFLTKARGLFRPAAPEAPASPAANAKKPATTHHAVSIVPGPRCCAQAQELRGQRFLSRDAPQLPLASCGRTDCTCRYEHYQDRRGNPRRLRDMGVAIDGWTEEDKRTSSQRGRRESEQK